VDVSKSYRKAVILNDRRNEKTTSEISRMVSSRVTGNEAKELEDLLGGRHKSKSLDGLSTDEKFMGGADGVSQFARDITEITRHGRKAIREMNTAPDLEKYSE
jgi:hypothetical protein